MENPSKRPKAVNLIEEAMNNWEWEMERGIMMISKEMFVYNALRNAGFLSDAAKVLNGS